MQEKIKRIEYLTEFLNECSDSYYNRNISLVSDAEYDKYFDELTDLQNETGYTLDNSPTLRAGYQVMSELQKVSHDIPLLSMAKTKSEHDVYKMASESDGNLTLKMDGLTVKITYNNGKIVEGATRGDGNVGELINHNVKVLRNVPQTIDYQQELVVTGEAFIDIPTFESINEKIENDEDKYATPRNLASGSVRQLDSEICYLRGVKFLPFSVLKGFEDTDSKSEKIKRLTKLGFEEIPSFKANSDDTPETILEKINALKNIANKCGYPIDGIVFTYDSVEYSKAQGKTSHHFKDGIAYKFGDPHFKTILKNIDWNISRTGQLTPIAEFQRVEIDNTNVEKASLHNITFIEDLKLSVGDEILVSKRNMIIPHVEENLSADNKTKYSIEYPKYCPICNSETVLKTNENNNRFIKVLYCENSKCVGKNIKKFTHFVSKPAMNIEGLSESTLKKFVVKGWIKTLADIFTIPQHKEEILQMEGFGEKSFHKLKESIENAKNTSLSNFLVAINISLLGKSAANVIEEKFSGDINKFIDAVNSGYNFAEIDGFGSVINDEIHKWFEDSDNKIECDELLKHLTFKTYEKQDFDESNMFYGKTVVITGTFQMYKRDELTAILQGLGAKVTGSVSSKTDFLLCGEDAGSKLNKAQSLGVNIIKESELKL